MAWSNEQFEFGCAEMEMEKRLLLRDIVRSDCELLAIGTLRDVQTPRSLGRIFFERWGHCWYSFEAWRFFQCTWVDVFNDVSFCWHGWFELIGRFLGGLRPLVLFVELWIGQVPSTWFSRATERLGGFLGSWFWWHPLWRLVTCCLLCFR